MILEGNVVVKKLSAAEWSTFSKDAHLVVFDEIREPSMDRIDFALITEINNEPTSFATVRELDSESIYWQYGGAFPSAKGSCKSLASYRAVYKWCLDSGYKRVSTFIKNTNKVMLKMALSVGFIPIGVRCFKNEIYLELNSEFLGG